MQPRPNLSHVSIFPGQVIYGLESFRRIERHLDSVDPSIDQSPTKSFDFLRTHNSENCDNRPAYLANSA